MSGESKTWSDIIGTQPPGVSRDAEASFFDAHVSLVARPRQLLSKLRDIMAGSDNAQDKLDQIVKIVSTDMGSDACSCYILRAGEVLERFATYGINHDPAHRPKIHVGDGLVGEIAAYASPLALADVNTHVNALSASEPGAEEFESFCGVPILRGRRVRGVLIIRNQRRRHYGEEVIETMQTVAMVMAELIMSGELVSRQEMNPVQVLSNKPAHLEGVIMSRGIAIGQAVLHDRPLTIREIVVDNPAGEKRRLQEALANMQEAIEGILSKTDSMRHNEPRDILEAYRLFARDRGWIDKIEQAIGKGLSAEAAVQRVLNETRARMMQIKDAYIRERLNDIEDLSNRLLAHLAGQSDQTADDELPEYIVLVARTMGPAALLDYDRQRLQGVLLEAGSPSNHVAIVARALGIPVIGQVPDALAYVSNNDTIVLDANHGEAYIRPTDDVLDLFGSRLSFQTDRQKLHRKVRDKPSVTKDGQEVVLSMNAGMLVEVPALEETAAAGIGLFRTELAFMNRSKYPGVDLQTELYSQIMDKAGDRPVVFRTLDIGGDKPLPYFDAPEEENPALGWRAVRVGLDRPAIFRTQFRAFIRGAKGRPLKIMLPFITEVSELDTIRNLLGMEITRAARDGYPVPEKVELGVMLEVPSLLWQLDRLLEEIDFISVGSNDLMQYLFAADRGNNTVKKRYDPLSPAMLKVLQSIVQKCDQAEVPVSVCGEMASVPIEAMALIGLGFKNLSMPPQSIGSVKTMIHSLDVGRFRPYLNCLLDSREHSLRGKLLAYARDHKIKIES